MLGNSQVAGSREGGLRGRVGSETPRHLARRSQGSNQRPPGCQTTRSEPLPPLYPVSFGQSTTTQEDQSQLHGNCRYGRCGRCWTHIQIIAPSKDEDVFVNRNKVHTSTRRLLLMQLLTFLMLLRSGLQGLPVIRRLSLQDVLTPLNPQPGAQLKYNIAHKNTRNVVERGIGQMKRRFHVLHGEIRLSPERESTVITVCAILHNRGESARDAWRVGHNVGTCMILTEEPRHLFSFLRRKPQDGACARKYIRPLRKAMTVNWHFTGFPFTV
ncbi:putative nuclease HARBI1 [Merluccius polli]|uniref:Nuclease HARBI1 n=1 Tax=Merluccius polli TaxID=89951 RepID=A0AA47N0H2_MERPO|nr:putative nuclease HARBI1 [Merluccius polli]